MTLKAALFELSTIVTSEFASRDAREDLAKHLGTPGLGVPYDQAVGCSPDSLVLRMLDIHRKPSDGFARFDARQFLTERTDHRLKAVCLQPGGRDLLEALRASGVQRALMTNLHSKPVADCLAALNVPPFDTIVSADDIWYYEPHPYAYELALRTLGLRPAHCIAVAHSYPSVRTAQRAGLGVLVVNQPTFPLAERRVARTRTLGGFGPCDLEQAWTDTRRTMPRKRHVEILRAIERQAFDEDRRDSEARRRAPYPRAV